MTKQGIFWYCFLIFWPVYLCFFFEPFSNTLVDSRKGKLLDGVAMELSLNTSAGPWLMGLGLTSIWTDMSARKIYWLMGLGLRSGWTYVSAGKIYWLIGLKSKSRCDVSAGKIYWLMGLKSKSRCDVSAGKLNSGKSRNSISIFSTAFRISSQMRIAFSCINHFQHTSEKINQST